MIQSDIEGIAKVEYLMFYSTYADGVAQSKLSIIAGSGTGELRKQERF